MKSLAITALFIATPAVAQDKNAEIDKIFAWTKPSEPGCAVAASHRGKQVVNRVYGMADLERDVPIKPETLFDMGSIRKQFVAASIFLLAEEGKLSVSDDVRKHVPELPDYGSKMTLEHLLTHTSGLRDWTGLLNLASGDPDAWTMILRQRGLNFVPGEEMAYRGAKETWYSGSAAGYKGWLGRYPEQGLSIAILCNSGDGTDRGSLARRIVDLLAPIAGPLETEVGPPPALTGDALADATSQAGLFFDEQSGDPLRLAVDRGRFRVAGGPGLVPVAKARYRRFGVTAQYMSEDKFELNFLSLDQFDMKSMEGQATRFRRARPYTPTEADLKGFAGDYESDELKAVIHMTLGKTGLMGRINETPGEGYAFTPVDRDTFQLGPLTLRFRRDQSGRVEGLDLSNPVFTRVKFTRPPDTARRE